MTARKIFHPLLVLGLAAAVLLWALLHAAQGRAMRHGVMQADPERLLASPTLAPVALEQGREIFATHCADCHGAQGRGSTAKGMPDLADTDFLYGSGLVAEVEQIVLHGIRSGDPRGWNLASMPAYARAKPYAQEPIQPLRPQDISDLAAYLRSFQGDWSDRPAVERGKALYAGKGVCWDCHAPDGSGDSAIGAPNLTDGAWLYGDTKDAITRSIAYGRAGSSPAFARSLTPYEARTVSLYVASLRGTSTRKTP